MASSLHVRAEGVGSHRPVVARSDVELVAGVLIVSAEGTLQVRRVRPIAYHRTIRVVIAVVEDAGGC